ncbi:YciI family protein [Nocardioides speluncae]|uniref:YciI family protein n=1 Tax=Nocardioides speluncae TaxID=2670337 RepID=UPI000D6904DD|nr:YciI family protein [Nocardioides speluncae]
MPRYLMAVYGPAEFDENYGYPSREEMLQSFAETEAFNERLKASGHWVFADGLDQASTTAAVVDGQGEEPLVTDGPYLETKEHIGGFWVIDVPDRDLALELAAEASKACRGKVEVRPFNTEVPG